MAEAARALGLDPAVLALQAVAFIILFLVLRRYLFGPLLAVMARREAEIAEALEAGERAKAELTRIDEERSRVLAAAREEGRQQVRQAVQEGEQARERILGEAREEVRALRERARQALAQEREEAELALRQQVVELALLAADRAVLQRLDPEAHRRAVDDFITSLEGQR